MTTATATEPYTGPLAFLFPRPVPAYLPPLDVAALFAINHHRVYHAIKTGTLPARRIGGTDKRAAKLLVSVEDAALKWGNELKNKTQDQEG